MALEFWEKAGEAHIHYCGFRGGGRAEGNVAVEVLELEQDLAWEGLWVRTL